MLALDGIHKLLAFGYLTGRLHVSSLDDTDDTQLLADQIVECVCRCSVTHDENVEVQVMKVLITAVTSSTCEVHGEMLVKAVFTFIGIL